MAGKQAPVFTTVPREEMPMRSRGRSLGRNQFTGQFIMGFVVTCACGCVFGIIALLLAYVATMKTRDGNDQEARKFGRWSYAVSILGIVIGSIAIVAIIVCISVKPRFGLPSQVYDG